MKNFHGFFFTGEKGFEPLAFGFGNHCSTVATILLLKIITCSILFQIINLEPESSIEYYALI